MINQTIGCFAIDLGSQFIRSALDDGDVVVLPHGDGELDYYAYVSFEKDQTIGNYRMMGIPANARLIKNPKNVVYDFKELLGRDQSDQWICKNVKKWEFYMTIMEDTSPNVSIYVEDKWYNIEQIAGMLFERVTEPALQYFTPKNVILTVPLGYNTKQRQAIKRVAAEARLTCDRLVDQSTAGFIAYHQKLKLQGIVLCVKIGHKYSQISLAELTDSSIHVLATQNIDINVEYFLTTIQQICLNSIDVEKRHHVENNYRAMRRLHNGARRALRVMNKLNESMVQIDSLYQGIDFTLRVTKSNVDILTKMGLQRLENAIGQIVNGKQPNYVIYMGGGTIIPSITASVQKILPTVPILTNLGVDNLAIIGAVSYFKQIERSKTQSSLIVMSITPHAYWIKKNTEQPRILIKQSEPYPLEKRVTIKMHLNEELLIEIYEQYSVLTFHHRAQNQCQLQLTFSLDINRIISVSAFDKKQFTPLKMKRQQAVSRQESMFKTPQKSTYLDDID